MQRRIQFHPVTKIRVIGVGSGGHAAIDALIDDGVNRVGFVAVDTDDTALRSFPGPSKD
jgi:cell division GTPase FtsZ